MASDFFLLASLILIGIVFFSIFQIYTSTQSSQTKEAEVRTDAEIIASLIYRISRDPSSYLHYCLSVPLSNITIKNGLLKYESRNYRFILLVPREVENSELIETTKACFIKKDSKVVLSKEKEVGCNFNGVCEVEECKSNCPDCYGPNNLCINDNFCNLNIGENCKNSADCSCNAFGLNYICCPENPSSNKYGCLYLSYKKEKGQECFCNEECKENLKCNPVDPSFTSYKKACCEENKKWNGSECIEIKPKQVYVITLVPVFYNNMDEFKRRAEFIKSYAESVLPFKERPGSLVILIGDENCPMSSETDFDALINCGNNVARKNGYAKSDLTGGIFGVCVGGDGCGGALGYTIPGSGFFVHGYDTCTIFGCPSVEDAVVAPHETGHNFKLCEGYCYSGSGCYEGERIEFGGYCGTSRIEQKFPYKRSAIPSAPCGNCGNGVCCLGRLLDNDPVNSLSGGRDIMGPGQRNEKRNFACDSYLAIKDVANKVYGFDLPEVTDEDIRKCYEHIRGDTYP
jgi:hypothetical protein